MGRRTRALAAGIPIGGGGFAGNTPAPTPTPTPTPTPGLSAFAFQPESDSAATAFAAAGSPINARRKYNLDRFIRRLKACGAWAQMLGIYIAQDTKAQFKINLKSPGTYDLVEAGTATYVANIGATCPTVSDNFDTLIPLSALGQNSAHCSLYGLDLNTPTTGADIAGINGANGLSLTVQHSSNNLPQARCMGALVTTGFGSNWSGNGFNAINRVISTEFQAWRHDEKQTIISNSSINVSSANTISIGRGNGRQFAISTIGLGLTDYQMQELYGACRTFYEQQRYGDIEQYEPGYLPASPTFDAIIYGATSAGLVAAYTMKRQGYNVAVVGGWNDNPANFGGMSTGGLAYVDFAAFSSLGGVPRAFISKAKSIMGLPDTTTFYTAAAYRLALQQMLDPAKGGQGVPIYYSTGIVSVSKVGTRLTSITTADGRTFNARYFRDESYESDLMALSGVSYVTGREAAGASAEAANGYRGLSAGNNFYNDGTGNQIIDPYVTAGVPASGLLPYILPTGSATVGQADNETQAYNFRLAVVKSRLQGVKMSATQPASYDKNRYEALLRWMAATTNLNLDKILLVNQATNGVNDVNNAGPPSTDIPGLSQQYVAATTYAQRKAVWNQHVEHIVGLMWLLQYDPDPRIPAAMRTDALALYWAADHFIDRWESGTLPHFSTHLYVREFRRMRGALLWDGNDLLAADGTTPRSIKTTGIASYAIDSHVVRQYADLSGTPTIKMEGGFFVTPGNGANLVSPLPYEIMTPLKAECENLQVGFGLSATHVAFGSIRMEETAKLLAQSGALAMCIAMENGDQAVQDVSYTTLRARILAESDAKLQSLPQVN